MPNVDADAPPRDPRARHALRLSTLQGEGSKLAATASRISTFRLLTFVGALALGVASTYRGWGQAGYGGALACLLAFLSLVGAHVRIDRKKEANAARQRFHELSIQRFEGQWRSRDTRGDRFLSADHPYAADLNIFGQGSLFQLLDRTFTRAGEEALARWLAQRSTEEEALRRQEAVRALTPHELFREDLAASGLLLSEAKPDTSALLKWAEGADPSALGAKSRVLSFALPVLTAGLFVSQQLHLVPGSVFVAAFLVQWLYQMTALRHIEPSLRAASSGEGALTRYRAMLELFEQADVRSPYLDNLRSRVSQGGKFGSLGIGRLSRIVGFVDARQNEVFRLFLGPLVLWDVHSAHALAAWKKDWGGRIRDFLEVIGELEALSSLASLASDYPSYAWPELSRSPRFQALAIGHPLLDPARCVCNDVILEEPGTALLVTGSNMSGKSTLLRAMGVNIVLALAGGPVFARSLSLASYELGVSMTTSDSLEDGASHFFAEVKKLKRVQDALAAPGVLFFLLDEILQGTNSRERCIGARSVLRHLLQGGAMGAVSTHDLGLLEMEGELDRRLVKVHLQEQIENDTMTFDYVLRPGVVTSTNALRLMKMVGIAVDAEGPGTVEMGT